MRMKPEMSICSPAKAVLELSSRWVSGWISPTVPRLPLLAHVRSIKTRYRSSCVPTRSEYVVALPKKLALEVNSVSSLEEEASRTGNRQKL